MSNPRPIHIPHRPINEQADEAEPTFSYEQEYFLTRKEDDVEDEFHRRLKSGKQGAGVSFWRTSGSSGDLAGPYFNSMSMNQRQDSSISSGEKRSSSKSNLPLLLQSPQTPNEQESSKVSKKTKDSEKVTKEGKKISKQRSFDRRIKIDALNSDIDFGHLDKEAFPSPPLIASGEDSVSRSSSDHSCSLFYGKALQNPRNGSLAPKSSSLIFPTGVETSTFTDANPPTLTKTTDINSRLDACETIRWPKKKKLNLENMKLSAGDIPIQYLEGTSLGHSLYKLSLAKNRLSVIPSTLVQCLPTLRHLDLSQCELVTLTNQWNLPQLRKLNLSHNKLSDFPEEAMLEGIPELQDLNMYGNKVAEIVVPRNPKVLSKLEILNLGYNDLAFLPDDLDHLKSLRTLLVMNNFLEKVPMRICEMDIRTIDVSSNPVIQPPIETCERGICSMRRYYHCLRAEEQVKHKALEEVQKKIVKSKKREGKNPFRLFGTKLSSSGNSKSFGEEETSNSIRLFDSILPNQVIGKGLPRLRSRSYDEAQFEKIVHHSESKSDNHSESELISPLDAQINSVNGDISLGEADDAVVNDTLKVIFVGMAMTGKTSMIKRLIEGKNAVIPERDERTIGVDIYEWDPCSNEDRNHVDTRIEFEDEKLARDVKVKFSVWDFAGQHVYHATHELFFSPHALYVIVWDMGATNLNTHRRKHTNQDHGTFSLKYDSSDDEEDDQFHIEEESRRADRALERDIDEKVQFWVECIQSCTPGAAILPVASFNDSFDNEGEAVRRCNILKARLLKHEERRIAGLKQRLDQYIAENKADDDAANRLRKLLCPYTRPKLLFAPDDNVVRVSGTEYTGFGRLTEHIVNIATGRDKVGLKYPIFRGHVGARIPRMRLEVRDTVREIRDKFKVVEFGYFISKLSERGLSNVEDISDALHFLTNTGELSYFGNVISDYRKHETGCPKDEEVKSENESPQPNIGDDGLEDYEQNVFLSMDETTLTIPTSSEDDSMTSFGDLDSGGLSHYIFLNPRWLVASVACILRHDLDTEIRETRRHFSHESRVAYRAYEGNLNGPVITAEDALMLWQAKKFTRKAADRAEEYSNNMRITPFTFLQQLLIRFGVFVPIDLSIEKALLGGKEYAIAVTDEEKDLPILVDIKHESESQSSFFFLPSLLGPGEPAEAWTYKNTDSWKITLCHSILFPDGVPPGLMERLSAAVLSTIYAVSKGCELLIRSPFHGKGIRTLDGNLRVREILCWRTAFLLKLGTEVENESKELKESIVEIFAHLVDRDSHQCVGSSTMGSGMRRLVISAKGQVGDGGRRIWNGGYLLVLKSVNKIMQEYGGLEFERQGFCPECLSKKAICDASSWDWTVMRAAAQNCETTMHCHHGHRIDTRLITGPIDSLSKENTEHSNPADTIQVSDIMRAVVLVGLWDGRARKIIQAGSGFIVDKKRGLIVTASHTLMNIWGDKSTPFGENYNGLRHGKVVIGILPRNKDNGTASNGAVFRYFARIVKKDPSIESKNECQMDACILRITTKLENDIGGNGEGCGDEPETLLEHNHDAMKRERLQQLKVTDRCELDEQVRIIGFNQGGEGILGPGQILNRYVDFARGYVCKKFVNNQDGIGYLRHRFKPREEIVVICPTIGGHSGGPCVNQQGEVIGILSRADPTEKQRCYLVPSYEWIDLIKQAKLCS